MDAFIINDRGGMDPVPRIKPVKFIWEETKR